MSKDERVGKGKERAGQDTVSQRTVFVCVRERDGKGASCAGSGSRAMVTAMRGMLAAEGLESELRVQPCGCLGLCKQGPVVLAATGEAALGNKPKKPKKPKKNEKGTAPGLSLQVKTESRQAVRDVLRGAFQIPVLADRG